ncbi:restriction endonuclease subunit S [Methanolobus bombayensis]|uniref:restriction endonuclease subunit S n=1 Tax=Methanolobus bombayensis TaxID=38023 RepID=UPI001AE8A150|nr:restriction endonuclease subunit S [Methanolobus bombayensis]MBP1908451.1 type I restriction enzyme S subunit [Methanolobus bombayensis]
MGKEKLPDGWKWRKLSDAAKIIMGQSPPGTSYNQKGDGEPFLQGKAEFGEISPNNIQYTTEPKKMAPMGSVLISVRAPVGDVNVSNMDYCIGRGLASISLCNGDNLFLYYLLQYLKPELENNSTGSTFKSISKSHLSNLVIPIPPLDVQQEIVIKIHNQIEEIKRIKERVEGNLKAASDLNNAYLKGIFEEVITQNYPVIKLKKLTSKIGSGSTPRGGKSVYLDEGIPFVRSMNVHFNSFKKEGLAHVSKEIDASMKNTRVRKDDVLLNITGASIGRVCVVPDEMCPANVNQHVSIIRTNKDLIPQYLSYYISNPNCQKFIMASESGATRQALTKTKIENFDIPLPPFETQQQIVEQLNEINELSKILMNQINSQLEAVNKLPASILNEIFGKYEIPEKV